MHSVPTLASWEVVLRLALAAVLGGAIGLEREIRDREAGLRTHLLVSLGSALFTLVSAYGFHSFLASGAGYYGAAVVTTVLVIVSLWPLRILARRIFVRFRPERERLVVDLEPGRSPAPVLEAVERAGGRVESLTVVGDEERRSIALDVDLPQEARAEAASVVSELEGVRGLRWG